MESDVITYVTECGFYCCEFVVKFIVCHVLFKISKFQYPVCAICYCVHYWLLLVVNLNVLWKSILWSLCHFRSASFWENCKLVLWLPVVALGWCVHQWLSFCDIIGDVGQRNKVGCSGVPVVRTESEVITGRNNDFNYTYDWSSVRNKWLK